MPLTCSVRSAILTCDTYYLQDTEVIGSRLKALQSEVELAEAELATHEETSTKVRAAALAPTF